MDGMNFCKCENASHEDSIYNGGRSLCNGDQQVEWLTIWGKYMVCNHCHQYHIPPKRYFEDPKNYFEGDYADV